MDTDLEKRCRDYAAHVAALSGLPCSVLDTVRQAFLEPASGRFCESCGFPRCQALNTHLYGSSEAYRWNGEYIYYCPAGLVFAAASVSDEYGEPAGSLVAVSYTHLHSLLAAPVRYFRYFPALGR